MIIFDNFDTAVSDHPQAMRFMRRPISRKIRSKSDIVLPELRREGKEQPENAEQEAT